MALGLMFLSALIAEKATATLVSAGPIEHLFRANEVEPFKFVADFVRKYQSLPSKHTVEKATESDITDHDEPAAYYLDMLRTRHVELTVKAAVKEIGTCLDPKAKTPETIARSLEIMNDTVMGLQTQRHGMKLVDFRHCYDALMQDYKAKYTTPDDFGLQFGWPTFDEMTGGLVAGDLTSFVGRPQRGKTFKMLKAARHGWAREGLAFRKAMESDGDPPKCVQSRLFVSMEMQTLPIQKRLIAMQGNLPMDHVKHSTLSTFSLNKMKGSMLEVADYGAPFWIVDGNLTATVEDIFMLAQQLKPGAIFIDGAYLLKHPHERDRFKRVAENCDLIKQNLAPMCPVVASWQFAKPAKGSKKKAADQQDIDDIGNTDAIAQHSSIILGLLQDESVETLNQRLIRVLKGRHGESGEFRIRWDFNEMSFDEYVEEELAELQFT